MAFVAFDEISGDILGVVRVHSNPAGDSGEYAILLRSDLKGRGLGWALMQMIIEYGKIRKPEAYNRPGSRGEFGDVEDVP